MDFSKATVSLVRHNNVDGKPDPETVVTLTDRGGHTNAVAAVTSAEAEAGYKFDMDRVSYGDTIKLNGKTYEIVKDGTNGAKLANGNFAVKWNGKTNADQDFVSNLAAAMKDTTGANDTKIGTPTVKGDTIYLQGTGSTLTTAATSADIAEANAKVDMTFGSSSSTGITNTIEFDIAKMKDGDKFTVNTTAGKFEVEYKDGDTRQGFMDKVKAEATKAGFGEVKGNALIIKDEKVNSIDLTSGKLPETNAIRIQVGANEHEQLSISIDSMNTKGLGLDDSTLLIAGASTTVNQDEA